MRWEEGPSLVLVRWAGPVWVVAKPVAGGATSRPGDAPGNVAAWAAVARLAPLSVCGLARLAVAFAPALEDSRAPASSAAQAGPSQDGPNGRAHVTTAHATARTWLQITGLRSPLLEHVLRAGMCRRQTAQTFGHTLNDLHQPRLPGEETVPVKRDRNHEIWAQDMSPESLCILLATSISALISIPSEDTTTLTKLGSKNGPPNFSKPQIDPMLWHGNLVKGRIISGG